MRALLKLSGVIDAINEKFGVIANWTVLLACLISAGNAVSRYLFSESSNGWLEVQWYMFAGMVLLGGPYTLKMNEHVRVDLIYGMVFADLGKAGPLVFESPPKLQGILLDFWQRPIPMDGGQFFGDVGLPGPDGGKGGKFLILPPGYKDQVPEGYYVYS